MKKAFTLIELVFVITILGIIVGISAEQIVLIYDNLIQKDEISRVDDGVESAVDTIDKMLSSSIKESIVMIGANDYSACKSIHEQSISGVNTLAWIGIEEYGRRGGLQDGYYMPFTEEGTVKQQGTHWYRAAWERSKPGVISIMTSAFERLGRQFEAENNVK